MEMVMKERQEASFVQVYMALTLAKFIILGAFLQHWICNKTH
jgi:hypothetical protein